MTSSDLFVCKNSTKYFVTENRNKIPKCKIIGNKIRKSAYSNALLAPNKAPTTHEIGTITVVCG